MKMPLKFWVGVSLAVVGIVLMSLPDKPCEDCDEEVTTVTVEETLYIDDEVPND